MDSYNSYICTLQCVEAVSAEYTIFGYVSGILFLLGAIYIPTLLVTRYHKTNAKVFWRLVVGTLVLGIFFILYTENVDEDVCGSACGPRKMTTVRVFPENFLDVMPISFPDIGNASRHIFTNQ